MKKEQTIQTELRMNTGTQNYAAFKIDIAIESGISNIVVHIHNLVDAEYNPIGEPKKYHGRIYVGRDIPPGPGRPDAVDDEVVMIQDESVLIDVLANDSPDCPCTELRNITVPPENGISEIIDNKIRYTPDKGFFGTDRLEYQITSSGLSNGAKVTIFVNPLDPTPVPPHPPMSRKILLPLMTR